MGSPSDGNGKDEDNDKPSKKRGGKNQSEGSFVRWQEKSLEQLGTTVHVILTLSTGALAYASGLVLGKDAVHLSRGPAIVLAFGALTLLLSVGAGLLVHWSRLSDFRWTARTARIRELSPTEGRGSSATGRDPEPPEWPSWLSEMDTKDARLFVWIDQICARRSWAERIWYVSTSETGICDLEKAKNDLTGGASELAVGVKCILAHCRAKSDRAGKRTWCFTTLQFLSFFGGMFLLLVGLGWSWRANGASEKEVLPQYSITQTILSDAASSRPLLPPVTVAFVHGDEVPSQGAKDLRELASQLHQLRDFQVKVEGFADCTGSDDANLKVSRARAENVSRLLIENDVPGKQIEWSGLGKDPGCSQGRRVEVNVLGASVSTLSAPPSH